MHSRANQNAARDFSVANVVAFQGGLVVSVMMRLYVAFCPYMARAFSPSLNGHHPSNSSKAPGGCELRCTVAAQSGHQA